MEPLPESVLKRGYNPLIYGALGCAMVILFFYQWISTPHVNPSPVTIHVSKGETLSEVAQEMQSHHIIRHASAVRFFVHFFSFNGKVVTGDYTFDSDISALGASYQLARARHNVSPIRVTIKEGSTNEQIADMLSQNLPGFRRDLFLEEVQGMQGYLFPDTYFIYGLSTADEIKNELSNTFTAKTGKLKESLASSGYTFNQVITMASLIQKEAHGEEDASVISGILWKRLRLGMLLQVDAAPSTYTVKGLPSEPIGNPGLTAIKAALEPTDSEYLFYLHDKNGMVHYATTFDEHKRNIAKYLR